MSQRGNRVRGLWVPAVAFALLALGTPARAQSWSEAEAAIAACFQAMDRDPALAAVNAKFARRDPTPAQLGDPTVPSEAEAEALRLRAQKTKPCRALRIGAVEAHHPLLKPAYVALYYQTDQVFSYLEARAIAYGAANRLAAAAFALFKAREAAYFAADARERAKLSAVWDDELQRAHSNPPPPLGLTCAWPGLNIECS